MEEQDTIIELKKRGRKKEDAKVNIKKEDAKVNIIQINTITGGGSSYPSVFGLGGDDKVYKWNPKFLIWQVYQR